MNILETTIKRRKFLADLAAGAAAITAVPLVISPNSASASIISSKRRGSASGLASPTFRPLPLGTVSAEGWLRRQLRIQADGLSGHLDEFWPDIAESQWFGGKAEGWERAPYWLDGVIPLAWVLDDQLLKAKLKRHVEYIVAHQRPDGWYSPYPVTVGPKPYDLWSILLVNKVLVQYHEATGDNAVLEAVMRNLKVLLTTLDQTRLLNWGRARWFEGLISVYYAYERTGEEWLLDLARKLHEQGFDYMDLYRGVEVTLPTPRRGLWRMDKHVVNTGMALKAYALLWRLTREKDELAFPARMLEILDRYHGQVTGIFAGDECLAGTNPLQGTELCAVVEALFSLELLVSLTGEPAYADRLERVAFNALPATFSPDLWAHQYDQQVNQLQCTQNPEFLWTTNGAEANLYGLEPNYGCCTSNFSQGWPKFAAHLWMRADDDGIAAIGYAPSLARFQVRGTPVRVQCETDYPFRETVTLRVTADQAVKFPLVLRVPAWTEGATVSIAGGAPKHLKPGTFHTIKRKWEGTETLTLSLPMKVKTSRRYNGCVAIERGPLVYSLKLGEEWKRVNADKPHRELPHGDFEVRPTTPWNYALLVDEADPGASVTFQEQPIGEKPFSPEGAGMTAKVKGRKYRKWELLHGWAGEIRGGPHDSNEPLEELTLIPYGCTNIRITEFPRSRE